MVRTALALIALAATPMALQLLADELSHRFWEVKLRREIRQSLQLRAAAGETGGMEGVAMASAFSPFEYIEWEQNSWVVMMAAGRTETIHKAHRIMGCLDRSSGELQVQERFLAPVPALCRRPVHPAPALSTMGP